MSAGGGRSAAALRYVTETATGMPFFGPRLAAQRSALGELAAWLPPPGQAAAAELGEAIDVLFPDPSTVPARTRFATTFGIVHRAEVPDGLAGLKLYGNLRTDGGALGRLARRWATFASLAALVDDLAVLAPHFATIEVDAAGRRKDKLYLRVRRANRTTLAVIARRFGVEAGNAFEVLDRAGTPEEVWGRRYFVCGEVADDNGGPELSVHLPSKALGLARAGMADLARRLMDGAGDGAALSALDAAADHAGGSWETTVVAIVWPWRRAGKSTTTGRRAPASETAM